MFGWQDLKEKITSNDVGLICPVKGCSTRLEKRQTRKFVMNDQFACTLHGIVFSQTTFEYQEPKDNTIWGDFHKFKTITSKRESRFGRDNSEDAVTWNIFRFLEKQGLLTKYLSIYSGVPVQNAKIIYWSHDSDTGQTWKPLREARCEFEQNPAKGSEPDLIVMTDKCLFFIEAKLTASNSTSSGKTSKSKKYTTGGDGWWGQTFQNYSFAQITQAEKMYELTRFWLIGSWIAEKSVNTDFRLINLVCERNEKNIEMRFRKYLPKESCTKFVRSTWENIYYFILANLDPSSERDIVVRYFKEKTIGYRNGHLKKAFNLPND